MGFLTTLRERLTEAVGHHPELRTDPLFGKMEAAGPALWRTTEPVQLLEGMPPITILVDADSGAEAAARETFQELQRRYPGLKASVGQTLCKAAPRVRANRLWDHACLASVEIWREPGTGRPVLALEYQLDDDPEYAYIVRVENWRTVDVLAVG